MAVDSARPGKGVQITWWVLRILVALAFLASGGSKLVGAAPMVAEFEKLGFGQWFRYLTGLLEVIGAIALLIPRFSLYGAGLLSAIMLGAIGFHLTILGGNPTAAIVLLLLSLTIVWLSRKLAVEV